MKAGSRGITILVASGDNGVQSSTNSQIPAFDPDFPASSNIFAFYFVFLKNLNFLYNFFFFDQLYLGPYITSVGATQLAPTSTDESCYNVCL
jgi:hypothetical protein